MIYRPLPYKDPGRLVKIAGNSAGLLTDDVSFADFADLRDRNRVFEQMAADDGTDYTVTIDGKATSVLGGMVTTSWLPTLGVQPIVGRSFLPEEDQPGRNRVVILTARVLAPRVRRRSARRRPDRDCERRGAHDCRRAAAERAAV